MTIPGRKQAQKPVRDARDFNNIETRAVIKFFFYFLQSKAPKEIHAILTETLACFLPGRAKDLSAPLFCVVMVGKELDRELLRHKYLANCRKGVLKPNINISIVLIQPNVFFKAPLPTSERIGNHGMRTTRTYEGNGGINPFIINLGTVRN